MSKEKQSASRKWPPDVVAALQWARESRSSWLTLRDKGLTDIPEEIFDLPELANLDLSFNRLRTVPERLWNLPNLQHVNLVDNPIEDLPNRHGLVIDASAYIRC